MQIAVLESRKLEEINKQVLKSKLKTVLVNLGFSVLKGDWEEALPR